MALFAFNVGFMSDRYSNLVIYSRNHLEFIYWLYEAVDSNPIRLAFSTLHPPTLEPPIKLRLPPPLVLAYLSPSWLMLTPTTCQSFGDNSPDVSRLCLQFQFFLCHLLTKMISNSSSTCANPSYLKMGSNKNYALAFNQFGFNKLMMALQADDSFLSTRP